MSQNNRKQLMQNINQNQFQIDEYYFFNQQKKQLISDQAALINSQITVDAQRNEPSAATLRHHKAETPNGAPKSKVYSSVQIGDRLLQLPELCNKPSSAAQQPNMP